MCLLVSGDWLKTFFEATQDHDMWLHYEGIEGCNDGKAQVRTVEWSIMRQCFQIVVWHPSFDVVDPHESMPTIEVELQSLNARTAESQKILNSTRTSLRRIQFRKKKRQQKESSTHWQTGLPPVDVNIVLEIAEGEMRGGRVVAFDHAKNEFVFAYGDAMLQRFDKSQFNMRWMTMEKLATLP